MKAATEADGSAVADDSLRLLLEAEERAEGVIAAAEEEAARIVAAARARAIDRLDALAADFAAGEAEVRKRVEVEQAAAAARIAHERDRTVARLGDAVAGLEKWKRYVLRRILADGSEAP